MDAKVSDLQMMIQMLFIKSNEQVNQKGFQNLTELFQGNVRDGYLYKKIYNPCQRKKPDEVIGLRDEYLDTITSYLGYKNYNKFVEELYRGDDAQLESCIGNYYSYVRINAKETVLLQSPARIVKASGKYILEIQGPRNRYTGEIESHNGCFFILLRSREGKTIHHVYKIGVMKTPRVLQGIFSRVSTSFDPIGGRAVLINVASDFHALSIKEIPMTGAALEDGEMETLFRYFEEYQENNLSIKKVSTFTMRDLR